MAVRRVKGVQKVEGDADEKTVTVEYSPDIVSLGDILDAIARFD